MWTCAGLKTEGPLEPDICKGIYITTAKFTKGAREYCNKQLNVSIKLVDGQKLADLMIKYNFGVSIVKTYEVKEVNDEFFETDIFW